MSWPPDETGRTGQEDFEDWVFALTYHQTRNGRPASEHDNRWWQAQLALSSAYERYKIQQLKAIAERGAKQ